MSVTFILQVFTSMALFNILIMPLNAFPWVLNGLMEAWVSVRRLDTFMTLPELNWNQYYTNGLLMDPDVAIQVEKGQFSWYSDDLDTVTYYTDDLDPVTFDTDHSDDTSDDEPLLGAAGREDLTIRTSQLQNINMVVKQVNNHLIRCGSTDQVLCL